MHGTNTFLVLALVLLVGVGSGLLAKRFRLPSVTGQIIAGVLIGPAVLHLIPLEDAESFGPVISFALALMAVDVGSHLSFRRLRHAKRRLALLVLAEVTITPTLVFLVSRVAGDVPWYISLLLATIAISTAPATVLALVKETRSEGVFVKTLIAAVALNNLFCILAFDVAHAVAEGAATHHAKTFLELLATPVKDLVLSGMLACVTGGGLVLATRSTVRPDRLAAASLIAIMLTMGLAHELGLSVLLSCLFLGVFIENVTPDKNELGPVVFATFELAIYAIFFTIAGMELQFEYLSSAGLLAAGVFAARAVGKVGSGYVSMRLAGATDRIRRYLGLALLPQAGLAVGLMLLVIDNPAFNASESLQSVRDMFLATVLAVVLLNELVGPVLTRAALSRSGDFGKDRARVLDFLHEDNIFCDLEADDFMSATEQLVDRLLEVKELTATRDELMAALVGDDGGVATCLGEGLALPHTRIPEGETIQGVMGIFPKGVPADTPDGRPLRLIVVFVTPLDQQDHHLAVLAAFARAIGQDANVRKALYRAHTPAHAYELLHADERTEEFNHYLGEDEVEA